MGETFNIEKILHGLGKASLLTFSPGFREASWGTAGVKKPARDWAWRPALSRQRSVAAKQLYQFGGSHFIQVNLTFHISKMPTSLPIRIPNVERVLHAPKAQQECGFA